jgi:CBS domain-containing protein
MRQTELLDEPITTEKDHDVSRIKVGEVISGKVYDCAPTDDANDALKTMRKKKMLCLPVVDGAGALKGILSIDDTLVHARKAKSKKSRKLIYKDAARAFQASCKTRLLKLARSDRERKRLGGRSEADRKDERAHQAASSQRSTATSAVHHEAHRCV